MEEQEQLKQTVANNIAQLRKSKGLTQLELAERLNYSDKAVSKWEPINLHPLIIKACQTQF